MLTCSRYQGFFEAYTEELGALKKAFDIIFSEQVEASSMTTATFEEYESLDTQKHDKAKQKISTENFLKLDSETIGNQLTYLDRLMFLQIDFRALISAHGMTLSADLISSSLTRRR